MEVRENNRRFPLLRLDRVLRALNGRALFCYQQAYIDG